MGVFPNPSTPDMEPENYLRGGEGQPRRLDTGVRSWDHGAASMFPEPAKKLRSEPLRRSFRALAVLSTYELVLRYFADASLIDVLKFLTDPAEVAGLLVFLLVVLFFFLLIRAFEFVFWIVTIPLLVLTWVPLLLATIVELMVVKRFPHLGHPQEHPQRREQAASSTGEMWRTRTDGK